MIEELEQKTLDLAGKSHDMSELQKLMEELNDASLRLHACYRRVSAAIITGELNNEFSIRHDDPSRIRGI